jgi:diguanylate cyclase (GGDEF)-like protein/PAS domain S-box-containing protein
MYKVFDCVTTQHDLRLVILAIAICALSSYTTLNLLLHVRRHVPRSSARVWLVWLGASAMSTGFGIWATHFIAMLAFSPGLATAYNVELTVLSLLVAIAITGLGLAIATMQRWTAVLGGALLGGGIAAMHYIGMAAFEVPGRIAWDASLVRISILLGVGFGASALLAGLRSESRSNAALGALLLTAAICGLHFTGMGAASVTPDPTVDLSAAAVPSRLLAVGVAMASFVVVGLALGGVALDLRERRRQELEAERMRGLANAAVEGLLICDGDAVITVNDNFLALSGYTSVESVPNARLEQFFPDEDLRFKLFEVENTLVESVLRQLDGTEIPVELIQREVDVAGKPHRAVAVRDLRGRKEAERNIRYLAHHDGLTGLLNRASFNKKLDHEIDAALQSGRRLAILFLDLDRFKEVNDLFGHAVGDRTLQAAAARISGALDDNQVLARLSGDEFAIILPDLSNPETAGRIAEAILEVLQAPVEPGEAYRPIGGSIGIAVLPDDADDRSTLLSHADTALYRAKHEGRSTYRYFEAAMGAAVHERRLLEHDLRHAIAHGEFSLVYQPQKCITSGRVVGLEALLRWHHPTRGEIVPLDFIPLAEDTGSILSIGEWVLRTACLEAATWRQPLTIAVNVSAVQIHSANFAHTVHEILYETGLPPERLELEITETALVRDLNRALATLRRIKMLGVRVAMDDFGTGYSSLSNLRSFPFDKIKIDGSFIRSVNVSEPGAAIVRSVLGLGHAMELLVLAEGVETAAEFEFLKAENCDEVQGFLLGRPADIDSYRYLTEGSDAGFDATVIPLGSKKATNKHT